MRSFDEIEEIQDAMAESIIATEGVALEDPKVLRLRAVAGPDTAYVFLTFTPGSLQVGIDLFGVLPDELPGVLRQVAEAVS